MIIFSGNLNRTGRAVVYEFTADFLGNGGSGVCIGLLTAVILVAQGQLDRTFERAATVEIVPAVEGFLLFELLLLHSGDTTRQVGRLRKVGWVEVVDRAILIDDRL